MPDIPGGYAPPGVFTRTLFDSPIQNNVAPANIPVLIGTGNEILSESNLGIVRGSSSTVDQRVVDEDETGRAIVSESPLTLGSFNGAITKLQVRNFPIVKGDGTGTTATDSSSVSVTIDGSPVVVLGIDGTTGFLELAEAPKASSLVRVTYFFNRTDTATTDDVSAQVTSEAAVLNASFGVAATYDIAPANNTFSLSVNGGAEQSVTFSTGAVAPAAVAANINGLTGVVASVFTNNFGDLAISLTATQSIVIGEGSANALLGFNANQATSRNTSFKVFNTPIVDGTNGGITTNLPSMVTVKVDNVQVIPTEVDGATGTVTLPLAPASTSTVTIQYFFNTWQDTFDYLAHIGITDITMVGQAPNATPAAQFIEDVSWVLKDDVIVWGTSSLVATGTTTAGATAFGASQVSTSLVDNRMFLAETDSVVDTSVTPTAESRTQFKLPAQPTTGNGRNNPLGTDYSKVANGRFDLPTNNPSLVTASVGFDLADAINRGAVPVNSVDPSTSTITLANPIEEGEKVFATFYYSTMIDETYTLTCAVEGVSGVGTYSITNKAGSSAFAATFGTKGAALTTIPVEFPSGSELSPDTIFVTPSDVLIGPFAGPVNEVVTVRFESTDETPAKYTAPGLSPYFFDSGNSETLGFNLDGGVTPNTIDLDNPSGVGPVGFFGVLTGSEIAYSSALASAQYNITATNNTVTLNVDGAEITASAGLGAGTLDAYVTAINTAAQLAPNNATLSGATRFTNGYTVAAGEYDQLNIRYSGSATGSGPLVTLLLAPGAQASATDLAIEVQAQITASGAFPAVGLNGALLCTANAEGRLVFALDGPAVALAEAAAPAANRCGEVEFIIDAVPAQDFAIIAGLATDTAAEADQVKLYSGPIARRFTVASASGRLNNDRIIIRNRIWPGQCSVAGNITHHHFLNQCRLEAISGTGLANCGLASGDRGEAAYGATIKGASLFGEIGWAGGQFATGTPAASGQPQVTFFDGTDPVAGAQNNTFTISIGNLSDTITFAASGPGTATPVGSAAFATSVVEQINTQLGGGPLATLVTCHQEGAGIRLVASGTEAQDVIEISSDTANTLLGFAASGASASRTSVTAQQVASALNHDIGAAGVWLTQIMFGFGVAPAIVGSFQALALATALKDDAGAFSTFIQSQTLGNTSQILVVAADGLREGTGFNAEVGDNAVGEAAEVGYFVTSSNPAGSGSANNSRFNTAGTGVGQDGHVGQTYTDLVTGLRFTVLARSGGAAYPTGATAIFTFRAGNTVITDANIPIRLPGIEMTVSNTSGVTVGDTASVSTFNRSGDEPSIGEVYYASYLYEKQDYSVKIFSKLSDIEAAFGPVSPNNALSLGAYLMFLNGAVQIGVKQVKKDSGSSTASEASFIAAIDSLEGNLPGNITPSLLVPLTTASTTLLNHLAVHCDVQSSIRYKSERTALVGFAAGTQPNEAGLMAKATGASRVRVIYPDIAVVPITDALGTTTEFLVDGRYAAAAMAGNRVSPNRDAATPWTGAQLVGFSALGRNLDAVQANQVAVNGVTVLEDRAPFLRVRQGLTTDMTNVLTKTPTVIQISDQVQQASRAALQPFIGTKFLNTVTGAIETRLTAVFKDLKNSQVIAAFTGIKVTVDPNDPTSLNVEAFYQPVFPLLYIVLTFNVRTSL